VHARIAALYDDMDERIGPLAGWRGHLIACAALALAVMIVFAGDVADMVHIWWTASTFEHCLFIVPIIGWLVHQRVGGLRLLTPVVWKTGLIWLVGGNFVWLLGDAAGVGMFRHAGVILMLQGVVASLLGWAVVRALLFPLFFAFFLIPFGTEMEAPLQLITAHLSIVLLWLAGVPAHIDGIFITTPNGYYKVAEACSGTKFVIAMAAYGALVCNVCFRSWGRRAIFFGGALLTCVLANGVRAFATIYVGYLYDVNAASGFDHVVYGWVFFGLVMVLVMAAAWSFFDRGPNDPWFDPSALQGEAGPVRPLHRMMGVALIVLLLAPTWSTFAAGRGSQLAPLSPPVVEGWRLSQAPMTYPWKPRYDGADSIGQWRYENAAGQVVDLAIATYARQSEGQELVGFGQGSADPASEWSWSSPATAPDNAKGEQITAPGPVVRHVVTYYRVGDAMMGSAGTVKLATLKARLLAGDQRAAAILISAEDKLTDPADDAIASFLMDLGEPKDLADAALSIR
jgi:exosortase A